MKLEPDRLEGANVINRVDDRAVWVNGEAFKSSLIVPWSGAVAAWNVTRIEDLAVSNFERLLEWAPELVVFGSGIAHRWILPSMHAALIARQIGVETMDTAAACRTFNVLATEGRRVLAALIIGGSP